MTTRPAQQPATSPPAPPSPRSVTDAVRVLAVGGESGPGPLQSLRQWAADLGVELEWAADLPRATRLLAGGQWDLVLAALGERSDEELTWWVDALRGAPGSPRLIALADRPSMGLALRAEKLGVLDVLALPLKREALASALERVRCATTEVALPLPAIDKEESAGQYALVGQSPAMLEV